MLMIDGDHPSKPLETLHNDPLPAKGYKMIKEVQSMVRNSLLHSDSELDHSPSNWLGFVWFVDLSFPTRPHTPHLEFICPFNQFKNRRHLLPKQNPAKARLGVWLDELLRFNFCQTLRHE